VKDGATAYRVTGRVQGVGFRWWTQQQAKRLGLRGYVRNLADGSVEVQASGSKESLAQLHSLLRRGPSGAQVTDVAISVITDAQIPANFRIL
jgi:acylphosphatase